MAPCLFLIVMSSSVNNNNCVIQESIEQRLITPASSALKLWPMHHYVGCDYPIGSLQSLQADDPNPFLMPLWGLWEVLYCFKGNLHKFTFPANPCGVKSMKVCCKWCKNPTTLTTAARLKLFIEFFFIRQKLENKINLLQSVDRERSREAAKAYFHSLDVKD